MFRFAQPQYLYLLGIIPIVIIGFIIHSKLKQRHLRLFGDPVLLAALMPNVSKVRPQLKFWLQTFAVASIIVALAQPQYGVKEQTIKRSGIEVMIALDISNSMLAQDVQPSRLDRAKQMLEKLVDEMVNDKVGLVIFAGDAYVQLPITCDYISAKMFISSITPSLVPRQGTAIGTALDMSIKAFGSTESESSRAIVLITDGENHEDDAVSASKLAASKGIQVFVVGIGRPEGSPMPIPGTMSFRKDKDGNVVVSKLNEDMCQQIAKAGNGIYVRADNTNNALRMISRELEKLAKSDLESKVFSEYNEQYQSFVILALLLLFIDFGVLGRKNKKLSKINLFK